MRMQVSSTNRGNGSFQNSQNAKYKQFANQDTKLGTKTQHELDHLSFPVALKFYNFTLCEKERVFIQ